MSNTKLYEKLADAQHEIWSSWMRYLFLKCTEEHDGSITIPVELVLRWTRQAVTPYQDLSEREKDSDREQANKVLTALNEMKWS